MCRSECCGVDKSRHRGCLLPYVYAALREGVVMCCLPLSTPPGDSRADVGLSGGDRVLQDGTDADQEVFMLDL